MLDFYTQQILFNGSIDLTLPLNGITLFTTDFTLSPFECEILFELTIRWTLLPINQNDLILGKFLTNQDSVFNSQIIA